MLKVRCQFWNRFATFAVLVWLLIGPSVGTATAAVVTRIPVSPDGGVNVRGGLPYNQNSAPAKMISDGNGGAYMVWKEQRNGINTDVNIYAQHFNSDGTALWTEGGVLVTTLYTGAFSGGIMYPDWDPDSVKDADNNLIVAWSANRDGLINNTEFYAQKLDYNTGNLLWSNSRVVSGSHGHTYFDADPIPLEVTDVNQYIYVTLTYESTDGLASVDNVLWDGTPLTEICSNVGSDAGGTHYTHVSLYGLANPDAISSNVTFSITGETDLTVSADVLTNVDAADPVAASSCINGGTGGGPSGTGVDTLADNSTLNDQAVVSTLAWGEATMESQINTWHDIMVNNYSPRPATELYFLWLNYNHIGVTYSVPTDADGSTTFNWGISTDYASSRDWSMGTVVFNLSSPGPLTQGVQVFNPQNSNNADNMTLTLGMDGYGAAIFAHNVDTDTIEGQRLNTNGQKQWGTGGTPLALITNVRGFWSANSDSMGYYLIAERGEGSDYFLRGYRLGEDGNPNDPISQGFINGVAIDSGPQVSTSYPFMMVVPDDGGGMTVLYNKNSGPVELYARRVYAPGDVSAEWLIEDDFTSSGDRAIIKRDTSSTAANTWYVAWYQNATQVLAQRYNFDSFTSVWGADLSVISLTGQNSLIEMEEDGDNGVFIIASDNVDNHHYVQGVRTDGTLLWDSTTTLDLENGTGRPSMARLSSGSVGAVWEETRSGETNLFFFQRLASLYQIRNLSGIQAQTTGGTNITYGSGNGVNNSAETVQVIDTGNSYPISSIEVNLTTDRDWSTVAGDVDTTNRKAVIENVTSAPGAAATHTLYVPYSSGDTSVIICPNATSLAQVTADCAGAITKVEADADTSITTVNGFQVWAITGMTGTGGISQSDSGSSPTPGTGSVDFKSATGTINNTTPTLTFSKSTTTTGGVGSYTVTLDGDKNRNFSVSDIPANGNGTAEYVWRDDDNVRVIFRNENDSDPNNDEISVYFKKLGTEGGLTQGKHKWTVDIFDASNNLKTVQAEFQLDTTAPSVNGLNLNTIGSVTNGGEYTMSLLNRIPVFSGQIRDPYEGSTRNNSNGSQDTFDKVSAGPNKVRLVIQQLVNAVDPQGPSAVYVDYASSYVDNLSVTDENGVAKTAPFSVAAPFPLADGWYRVNIITRDNAGNETTTQTVYLSYNAFSTSLIPGETPPIVSGPTVPLDSEGGNIGAADPTPSPIVPSLEEIRETTDEAASSLADQVAAIVSTVTEAAKEVAPITALVAEIVVITAVVSTAVAASVALTTAAIASSVAAAGSVTAAAGAVGSAVAGGVGAAASTTAGAAASTAAVVQPSWWTVFTRFLQAMGFLAQHAPQGVVLGSQQFEAVPFALLTVTKEAKPGEAPVIETVVTDTKGVYQGVKLPAGTYNLAAAHQQYSFPSRHVRQPYQTLRDFYRGEPFSVKSAREEQLFVVPVDPRQPGQKSEARLPWWQRWATRLSFGKVALPLSVFTIVMAVVSPSLVNIGIAAANGLLVAWKARTWLTPPAVSGKITTAAGQPIQGAVVRLGRAEANQLAAIAITDSWGKYQLFAPKGLYQLSVTHPDYVQKGAGMSFDQLDTRQKPQEQSLVMEKPTAAATGAALSI